MSKGEEEVKSIKLDPNAMPKGSEVIQGKPTKAQMQEQYRQQEQERKVAAKNRAEYRKELISNNELKQQQVTEIQLNILYYKAKKEWFELMPEIEALEAREKAEIQKEREEQQARVKEMMELQKKKDEEENAKPKIVVPKIGKPRE